MGHPAFNVAPNIGHALLFIKDGLGQLGGWLVRDGFGLIPNTGGLLKESRKQKWESRNLSRIDKCQCRGTHSEKVSIVRTDTGSILKKCQKGGPTTAWGRIKRENAEGTEVWLGGENEKQKVEMGKQKSEQD